MIHNKAFSIAALRQYSFFPSEHKKKKTKRRRGTRRLLPLLYYGSTTSDGAVEPAAGVCGGGGHGAAAMEERLIGDVPDGVQTLAAGTRWVSTSTSTNQRRNDAHSDRLVATVQGGDQPRRVA